MTCSEIHIWGDSLARGVVYNTEKKRYAISSERCANRLQSVLGYKVINHSVMGATVEDGLRSFESVEPVPGAICAIEFGGNDCDLDWAYVAKHPEQPIAAKVPLPRYIHALTSFVRLIRERGMRAVLITPPPLHAPRYFSWVTRELNGQNVLLALGDVEHIYRWQERYTIAMRAVANAMDCPLMDVRDRFLGLEHYEDYICEDGIHPNDAGHRVIADTVLEMAARAGMPPAAIDESQNRAC